MAAVGKVLDVLWVCVILLGCCGRPAQPLAVLLMLLMLLMLGLHQFIGLLQSTYAKPIAGLDMLCVCRC